MINEIEDHHRDEEIVGMNMQPEMNFWEEQLQFVSTETEFYSKLLTDSTLFRNERNKEDLKYLLKQLEDLAKMTKFHLDTLKDFKAKMENIRECDDVQCENQYIKEHLLLKKVLQNHWKRSLNSKKMVFAYTLGHLSQ